MERMVKVNYKGIDLREFKQGTTLLEISKFYQKNYRFPILIAKVNNDIMDLSEPVVRSCTIDFYDRSNEIGNGIYAKGLHFILVLAVKRVFGVDSDVSIEYSIDKGFYCELSNAKLTENKLQELEREMHKIVEENLFFTKLSVSRLEAIEYFKKRKQIDKAEMLKYISNTYINLYRLDDYYDYFYGEMPYNTSAIDTFKLDNLKNKGFVVTYPDIYNPDKEIHYIHHKALFQKFLEYKEWGKSLKISRTPELNEMVSKGNYRDLIYVCEAYYNRQLAEIADHIEALKKDLKLILIAGPSSSGKTTTSKKLEIYLKSKGLHTHPISIDDYFIDRSNMVKDENGEYDFESIEAVDVELFNKHLSKLLKGEKVSIPEFNFVTGKKEYHDKWLQLKENDIIIVEGLHALNDVLTSSIERSKKFKIYISPLAKINIDNHNRIHTSDTRKIRRLVRDHQFRGYTASETLGMWNKIRKGEEKWIFPFQDDSDYIVNSSFMYEISALKTYVEPLLYSVEETDPMYPEAIRLINILRCFLPIPSDDIPKDSILREFIGGSCF